MRTLAQFNIVYEELMWFTKFHNKTAWLVPYETGYEVSIIEPHPNDLPVGTGSNLYDQHGNIHQTVVSSNI